MSLFPFANKKVLVIYLHDGSNIGGTVVSNQAVKEVLKNKCVLWQYDISQLAIKRQLVSTLMQCAELNGLTVQFPVPFGLENFSLGAYPRPSVASRICNLLSRQLLSLDEFPRIYIVIGMPILESAAAPAGVALAKHQDSSAIASALTPFTTSSTAPALTTDGAVSLFKIEGTFDLSTASTSSASSTASAVTVSAAPNVVGITASNSLVLRTMRCCVHEVAASAVTAVELVSKLNSAYNNYNSIYKTGMQHVQVVADKNKLSGAIACVDESANGGLSASGTQRKWDQPPPLQPVPPDILVLLDDAPFSWTPRKTFISLMTEISDYSDFGEARQLFLSLWCSGRKLHHIYRVENPALYKQYIAEKRKMDERAEFCNEAQFRHELYLYHGTNVKSIPNINEYGFDRSYAGANATQFGHGSYFARDLRYSVQATYSPVDPTTGHKFVYVARVLVGRFCQGAQDMQHPPLQTSSQPFDSAVDNVLHPNIFVIFRDTRAYPFYLYEFS